MGDSAIVLGVQDPDNPDVWIADPLTIDHKPESIGKLSFKQQILNTAFKTSLSLQHNLFEFVSACCEFTKVILIEV